MRRNNGRPHNDNHIIPYAAIDFSSLQTPATVKCHYYIQICCEQIIPPQAGSEHFLQNNKAMALTALC